MTILLSIILIVKIEAKSNISKIGNQVGGTEKYTKKAPHFEFVK